MKIVIQTVKQANIKCFDEQNNVVLDKDISKWLVVYVGICNNDLQDTNEKIEKLINKLLNLKFFEDENGKLKLSLSDIKGDILLISNFTLCWTNKKGRAFDFSNSAPFKSAKEVYELIYKNLLNTNLNVVKAEFGTYMEINQTVVGPVNFILEI